MAESETQPCITLVETRIGVVISFMCARKGGYEDLTKEILRHFEACGFLSPVIIHSDQEMSIIAVCRKVARQCYDLRQKQVIRATGLSKQYTDTYRTRTMLPDTNQDDHCHTAFSNFTCHPICHSSRWICALKIHSATRRQNTIQIFARNFICITFVHVW